MLRITARQMDPFQRTAQESFEDGLAAHCRDLHPALARALGAARLRAVVHEAVARAASYGLTLRGPARLFVELCFALGSGFDTDPQYPWARAHLTDTAHDPMTRASAIHEQALDVLIALAGTEGRAPAAARRRLAAFLASSPEVPGEDLEGFAVARMAEIYPEKAATVGDPALRAIFAAARAEADRRGLGDPRGVLVLAALMFAYGQGCTTDPIHPWIGEALAAGTIEDAAIAKLREVGG